MEHFTKKSYEMVDDQPDSEKKKESGFIAKIINAPQKFVDFVTRKQRFERVEDEGFLRNHVDLDEKAILPKLVASSALHEAENALEKEEEFFRDKKNAKLLSKINQELLKEEEEEIEGEKTAQEDDLINNLQEQEKVLLESRKKGEGVELETKAGIIEDGGVGGGKGALDKESQGKLQQFKQGAEEVFSNLGNLLKSKSAETAEEMGEKANDFGDLGSTCAELANKLGEMAKHATEAGGHASNAAVAAPIVGAAISLALLAKKLKDLSSVWRRLAKQHKIKGFMKDQSGEEESQDGFDAAVRCVKDIQEQERNFLVAEIGWQGMAAAGHLASLTGAGAIGGLPTAIAAAVGGVVTGLVKMGMEYKEAHDHHKAAKALEQDGVNDDHAVKVIRNNPQKATQIIINQAVANGEQGPLVCEFLKSFGVKDQMISDMNSADEEVKMVAGRKVRLKVLKKLGREDEDPARIQEDLEKTGTAIKNYVPSSRKVKASRDLREAKNLLLTSGMEKRGTGWLFKDLIFNPDPEKEKAQLLGAIMQALEKGELEKADDITLAIAYLQPTKVEVV